MKRKNSVTSAAGGVEACLNGDWLMHLFGVPNDKDEDMFRLGEELGSAYVGGVLAPPPDEATDEDAEIVTAKEMNAMSLQERELCYEDIHGVAPRSDVESPEFLQVKLEDMAVEIVLIGDKEAYDMAQKECFNYVEDPDRRLQFLRSEDFDVVRAAHRYVGWFQLKLELFGKEKLCTDITVDDLDPDSLKSLKSGRCQVLPTRDRGGRAVVMDMMKFHSDLFVSTPAMLRMIFYFAMSLVEDVETQRSGAVCVHYAHSYKTDFSSSQRELNWKASQMMRVLPLKVKGFHFLSEPNPAVKAIINFFRLAVEPRVRHRFRSHYGSPTENHYSLLTYGIPTNQLPITDNGNLKTTNHLKWIEQRRKKERMLAAERSRSMTPAAVSIGESESPETDSLQADAVPSETAAIYNLPSKYDVLLGRGRPFQDHSGNLYLKDLIASHYDEYDKCLKKEKTALAEKLIKLIREEHNGRFLKKNSDGFWVEAPFSEAREKVAHGFRKKREMDKSAKKAVTVGDSGKRVRVEI